jgi:hypothetical protein
MRAHKRLVDDSLLIIGQDFVLAEEVLADYEDPVPWENSGQSAISQTFSVIFRINNACGGRLEALCTIFKGLYSSLRDLRNIAVRIIFMRTSFRSSCLYEIRNVLFPVWPSLHMCHFFGIRILVT